MSNILLRSVIRIALVLRRGLPQEVAKHIAVRPKRRTIFGEQTYGNSITFTVDGEETFERMYDAIDQAKSSVYIANYDMDPRLRFVRRPREILGGRHAHESYTLQKLLTEKAQEGVEIKIIVWEPRLVLRLIPGADQRGIDGRADEVEGMSEIALKNGLKDKLMVRVDSTAPTLTSAHHEKIAIIDNKIGFCGGFDLSRGKWDTASHEFNSMLRDPGSEPWHDVQAVIEGPLVWDLVYHFHQRWAYSFSKDPREVRKLKVNLNYSNVGRQGSVMGIAVRTWKELNRNGGIRLWYSTMFRNAKDNIYIENQFPFQDSFATRLLERRLLEQPSLRVIIVGPMHPNLPGFLGSVLAKISVNDVRSNLARLRAAGGDRIRTYSLIAQDNTVPEKRRQIYVHSKVMMVDDKWVTVGSANIDKNGFRDSSELNIGISSEKAARDLRIRLWMEHLGLSEKRQVSDFNTGFDQWERLVNENGRRVESNQPIRGHVYYYNFEEMNYPPPYPEATKSARFAVV